MSNQNSSVNFGSSSGGLSTVGYTLKNFDGSTHTLRSTNDVVEIGTNTGIYSTSFELSKDDNVIVLWDTGTTPNKYAIDEKFAELKQIHDETDKIRLIWNTIQQDADFRAEMLMKMNGIDTTLKDKSQETVLQKVLTKVEKDIVFPELKPVIDPSMIALQEMIRNEVKLLSDDVKAQITHKDVILANINEVKGGLVGNIKSSELTPVIESINELANKFYVSHETLNEQCQMLQSLVKQTIDNVKDLNSEYRNNPIPTMLNKNSQEFKNDIENLKNINTDSFTKTNNSLLIANKELANIRNEYSKDSKVKDEKIIKLENTLNVLYNAIIEVAREVQILTRGDTKKALLAKIISAGLPRKS